MNLLGRLLVLGLAALCCVRTAEAQRAQVRPVEVHVNSVIQGAAFLDTGSASAIQVGDRVRFHPVEGPSIEGVVRLVSTNSARVELLGGATAVAIGTRAEVFVTIPIAPPVEPEVPVDEEAAPETTPTEPPEQSPEEPRLPPENLPWSAPPEDWNLEIPLLAESKAKRASERPVEFRGRIYSGFDYLDDGLGVGRKSYWGRSGADLRAINLFGAGGELRFDGEVYGRTQDSGPSGTSQDSRLRVENLSYLHGGRRDAPLRLQAGRFQQSLIPELGRVDGVESSYRFGNGMRVGVSAGHLPETDDSMGGDDYQAAVFFTGVSGPEEVFDWRLAYQKTWHESEDDRDLIIVGSGYRPSRYSSIVGTAWIDRYDSGDTIKDHDYELTRATVAAMSTNLEGDGVRLHYFFNRWPQLLRQEFPAPAEDPLLEESITRFGGGVWKALNDHLRFHFRVDSWDDDEDSGLDKEVRLDVRDALPLGIDLGLAVYDTEGDRTRVNGTRFNLRSYYASGFWDLSWNRTEVRNPVEYILIGKQLQNDLRATWDAQLFDLWHLSLYGEKNWGDEQDSYSVGFYLQRSF